MKKIIRSLIIVLALFNVMLAVHAQQKEAKIRVATFNLRMDTPRDSLNAWPNRKEFVKQLIRFHDFDIIGTQEGFAHQLEGITELQEYIYTGVGRDDGKKAGEHSAIIYKKDRFTLLESGNFWLRETPDVPGKGWDGTCCNRIASWAKFRDKTSGKTFYFFNVHYDHQGVVARRESSKLMLRKTTEIAKNAPVILTGDFNSTPESEQIVELKTIFKDSYDVTEQQPYGPVGTFNSFRLNSKMQDRIDYIFLKGNFRVLKYGALTDFRDGRFPSDHLPVMADIVLN